MSSHLLETLSRVCMACRAPDLIGERFATFCVGEQPTPIVVVGVQKAGSVLRAMHTRVAPWIAGEQLISARAGHNNLDEFDASLATK